MYGPDTLEVREKERRVRDYLRQTGLDYCIIGRRDNFAWFTGGGDNTVVMASEFGFTLLVITLQAVYAVAQTMDGPRVMEEELAGLGVEPVFLRWYEASREEKAAELVRGLGGISDLPIQGARLAPREIQRLHYPLTAAEIGKCRELGRLTDSAIRRVADLSRPGMTEREIAAILACTLAELDAVSDVLLVGSDERIAKFRHPNPSAKKVERLLLLHPAARKWGLHANVTRMVYFGDRVPDEIARKYDAACRIEAAAISMCRPGERFSRILEAEKSVYRETGFADEWRHHFQGGITGYLLADPNLCNDPEAEVSLNQAYDWFITITGVKVEELSINTESGCEVISATGRWPAKDYGCNGQTFGLPQILLK